MRGSEKYADDDFTPDNSSLFWADMGETSLSEVAPDIKWTRATEAFSKNTLFGSGISPDDINQGGLGNCWFLSAASAVAEKPGRMERVFLNRKNELSANGVYAVNLFALGVPHSIVIDDFLPVQQIDDGKWRTEFAAVGDDESLWGMILEKAFSKYHGNYNRIAGGNPSYGVRTLVGGPYEIHAHADYTDDALWNILKKHDGKDDIIQAGTPGTSDADTNADGLV